LIGLFGVNVEVLPFVAGDMLFIPSASFHMFIGQDCVRLGTGLVSPGEMTDYVLRQAVTVQCTGQRPFEGMDGAYRPENAGRNVSNCVSNLHC
jgi:hypothetical protein